MTPDTPDYPLLTPAQHQAAIDAYEKATRFKSVKSIRDEVLHAVGVAVLGATEIPTKPTKRKSK